MKDKFNNQFATQRLRAQEDLEEEGSVTGGGEAYLPGLDVPEEKYKGPKKESKLDKPYKKVKGFRPGHTEDKGGFQYDDLWDLNENYSRFKKETKTRTNEQQLHAAMRLAEKKIHEANRILEYTSKLRTELNETRANKNTQKLMEKITRGIAEAYGKMKKMK